MKEHEVGAVSKESRRPVAIGIALACLVAVLGMGSVLLLMGPAAESQTSHPVPDASTNAPVEGQPSVERSAKEEPVTALQFPSLEDPQRWTRQRITTGKRHHGAIVDIYIEHSLRLAIEQGQEPPHGATAALLVRDGLEQILRTFTMRRFRRPSESGWTYGQLNSKGSPLQTRRPQGCKTCHQSEPNIFGLKGAVDAKL